MQSIFTNTDVSIAPELKLLIACSRTEGTRPSVADISSLLQEPLDWSYFLQAAQYHGLAPLAWSQLQAFTERIPPAVSQSLRTAAGVATLFNLRLVAELRRLLPALEVDTLPYKGPLLSEYLYGSISLRTAIDLDIIIPRRDIHTAMATLHGLEFRLDPPLNRAQLAGVVRWGHELCLTRAGIPLDLHWDIVPRGFGLRIDMDSVLRRTTYRRFSGLDVRWPAPEDHLILFAAHAAKHLWRRLSWIADTAALVLREPNLDLSMAINRAGQWGCRRMILITLLLAGRLFGAEIGNSVLREAERDNAVMGLAEKVIESMGSMCDMTFSRARHFEFLRVCDKTPQKFRYVWSIVLEPQWGDFTAVPLPSHAAGLYPLVRLMRLPQILWTRGSDKR